MRDLNYMSWSQRNQKFDQKVHIDQLGQFATTAIWYWEPVRAALEHFGNSQTKGSYGQLLFFYLEYFRTDSWCLLKSCRIFS